MPPTETIESPPPASNSSPQRKFARAQQLAAQIGVSAKTLRRWAAANPNKIHVFKVTDSTVLFDEAEVLDFVASARVA